jgi:hypothetical protein
MLHVLQNIHKSLAVSLTGILFSLALRAQTADANNGINQANTMVRSYFEAGAWFLVCIFLVIVSTVLKSFLGL